MEPPKLHILTENQSQDDFYRFMRVDSDAEPSGAKSNSSQEISSDYDRQTEPQENKTELYSLDSIPNEGYDNDPKNPNTTEFRNYKVSARIFFIISIVSAILILVFEIYMYAVINVHKIKIGSDIKYKEISIYLALFIFASIFQVFITWVGLRSKNMLLLLTLCLFYACMLIYTGIQYQEISEFVSVVLSGNWKTATRAMNIATIVVLAVTMLVQAYLILGHLNSYVNWFSFKTIGGDIRTKRFYQVFQIHRSLLIFGFFFFLAFTIQFLIIMSNNLKKVEFILTVIVLPLTIILLIASDYFIAKEILVCSIFCLIIYFGGIAYVLFKMIRLYTKYTSAYSISVKPGVYFPGRNSLITFGVITLLFLVGIVTTEITLMINFNKGLKQIVGSPNYRIFSKTKKVIEKESNDDEISIN